MGYAKKKIGGQNKIDFNSFNSIRTFDKSKYFGPPIYNISTGLNLTASQILPNRQFNAMMAMMPPQQYYPYQPQQHIYSPQIVQPQQGFMQQRPMRVYPEIAAPERKLDIFNDILHNGIRMQEEEVPEPIVKKSVKEIVKKPVKEKHNDEFEDIGRERYSAKNI